MQRVHPRTYDARAEILTSQVLLPKLHHGTVVPSYRTLDSELGIASQGHDSQSFCATKPIGCVRSTVGLGGWDKIQSTQGFARSALLVS